MARKKREEPIVSGLKRGDERAFEEVIENFGGKVFNLAMRLTRNREDAEEVLQDVFTTVFRKINGFEGKSSFSSWLYRVTTNCALMKLRKNRQEKSSFLEDILPEYQNSVVVKSSNYDEGDIATLRHQLMSALELAIKKLPHEYRSVFILRDVDGLTTQEVGEILDLTAPAVKSRLHRSRLLVRKRLEPFIFADSVLRASAA